MTLDLKDVSTYWLKWNNRYFINAEKFNITHEELAKVWVVNDRAYLNSVVCEQLVKINKELENYNLEIIVKDAYRSEELYELIIKKRKQKEGEDFVSKIFNTKLDFPHASGNTLDVAFINKDDWKQIKCFKDVENIEERRRSRSVLYCENSNDPEEIEIHKNRIFMRDVMNRYWFIWIDHEYRHFNYVW